MEIPETTPLQFSSDEEDHDLESEFGGGADRETVVDQKISKISKKIELWVYLKKKKTSIHSNLLIEKK